MVGSYTAVVIVLAELGCRWQVRVSGRAGTGFAAASLLVWRCELCVGDCGVVGEKITIGAREKVKGEQ